MRAGVFLGSFYGTGLPVFVILGSPVSEKNSSRRLGEPSAKGDDVRSGLGLPCRRGCPARVNIESLRDLVNQYMMQMYYFYALKAAYVSEKTSSRKLADQTRLPTPPTVEREEVISVFVSLS